LKIRRKSAAEGRVRRRQPHSRHHGDRSRRRVRALGLLVAALAALLDAANDPKAPRLLAVVLFLPVIGEILTSLAIIVGLGATIRATTQSSREAATISS
jgi:hypothetical protein